MSAEEIDDAPIHWVESLIKLQEYIQDDDEEESLSHAINTCQNLLEQNNDDMPEEVRTALYQTWIQSEMRLDHYDQVASIVKKASDSIAKELQPLAAYALYRLGKHSESFAKASKDQENSLASTHIQAQSLFRLNRTKEAMELYQEMLNEKSIHDQDEQTEIMTNALAVILANGTPYVGSQLQPSESLLSQSEKEVSTKSLDSEDYPYDLAYNLATWQLLSSDSSNGHGLLEQARQACVATCQADGASQEEVQKEVAPIVATLGWSRLLQGSSLGDLPEGTIPSAVESVVDSNKAVDNITNPTKALSMLPESPDTLWTASQRREYYYNRAILYYRVNKLEECRASLQELQTSLLAPKNKKKLSMAAATAEDVAWWQARADVVEGHCLVLQNKQEEAVSRLNKRLEQLEALSPGRVVDHAVAHVRLHLNELKPPSEQISDIDLLRSLPESIRSQKAAVATLASLYHEAGQTDEATKLLQECGSDADVALADFHMSQHQYKQAAELYEGLASDNNKDMMARWVQALSFVDPQRADEVWQSIEHDDDDDDEPDLLDADALEAMEPPRFKTARSHHHKAAVTVAAPQRRKSHEAVLRRRARKREEYLANKGITNSKPDPERWLPKHERSRGGRRKKRPQKSHQGGASEKDAAKLDAAARKSGATPNTKSTAHINVASNTKRGGGRRR